MENTSTSAETVNSDDIETFTVMDDGQETVVDGNTMIGMIGSFLIEPMGLQNQFTSEPITRNQSLQNQ